MGSSIAEIFKTITIHHTPKLQIIIKVIIITIV